MYKLLSSDPAYSIDKIDKIEKNVILRNKIFIPKIKKKFFLILLINILSLDNLILFR